VNQARKASSRGVIKTGTASELDGVRSVIILKDFEQELMTSDQINNDE
jgi:hypothetical protein